MSQSAISMPLITCVSVPPRPIQNVFWCSFSVTRSGSSAFSPRNSGSSTCNPACTRRPSVNTLPCPVTPASVCTAISAWIESSCLISADHPPFGLSPNSGTAWIDRILTVVMAGTLARLAVRYSGGEHRVDAAGSPRHARENWREREDARDADRRGRLLLSVDARGHPGGRRQPGRAFGACRQRQSCRLGRMRGVSLYLHRCG